MKKIKDFIYNTSDILVATVILVAAIGIIFWRMQVILDYPTHLFGNQDVTVTDPIGQQDTEQKTDPVVDPTTDPTIVDDPVGPIEPEETPLWVDGRLSREVTVTVTGSTATSAIQCLVEVGIYDSFADFDESCKRINRNHNNVRGGVKTFDAGMTKDEITKEMTFVIK